MRSKGSREKHQCIQAHCSFRRLPLKSPSPAKLTYLAMKTAFVTVLAAAILALACADHTTTAADQAKRLRVDVGSANILERPVGVVNKNNLLMDNNMVVAKSNVMMTQNDRVVLRKKIEAIVMSADPKGDADVLSRNVMRVVSDKDTDKVTMSKASAVVAAARSDDKSTMSQRITDLLNSAMGKSDDDSDDASDSSSDSSDVSSDADAAKKMKKESAFDQLMKKKTKKTKKPAH